MGEALSRDLAGRLADELDGAGALLESLAVQLCVDPVVFERHAGPLQRFDRVTQVIGQIAGVLRCSGSREDAIAAIRLDDLRQRMADAN